jgi:antitoxin component of MazEF toxin-antitoxin module
MVREYSVKRKLQEQSGSYFVVLPKIWVKALDLQEGDIMSITFNDVVKVEPMKRKREHVREST